MAVDVDGDGPQGLEGLDELLDAHPGDVLQVSGHGQGAEYHGQVGLDGVALVVEHRPSPNVGPELHRCWVALSDHA